MPIPAKLTLKASRTGLEMSSGAGKKLLATSARMKWVAEPVRKESAREEGSHSAGCWALLPSCTSLMLLPRLSSAKLGWIAGQVLPSPRAASGLCPLRTAFTPGSTSLTLQTPSLSPAARRGDGERVHGGVKDRSGLTWIAGDCGIWQQFL